MHWYRIISTGILFSLLWCFAAVAQDEFVPVVEGALGKRVFDQLGAYYGDKDKDPSYSEAIIDLTEHDKAQESADYILALLKQSFEDEKTGRSLALKSPKQAGGWSNPAAGFRRQLAFQFSFAGPESYDPGPPLNEAALEPALWLIEEETSSENQENGIKVLRKVQGTKSDNAITRLLKNLPANEAVAVGLIEEAGGRNLKGTATDIQSLCSHNRKKIREAARKVAPMLGIPELPEFKPEEAFTPWLEEEMRNINTMILTIIPDNAKWVRVKTQQQTKKLLSLREQSEFSGWLLREDEKYYYFLGWFAAERILDKSLTEITPRTFGEDAEYFLNLRKSEQFDALNALSRYGGLSRQNEPHYISLPELLVAAWSYKQGDKGSAATILFNRIDEMKTDRNLHEAVIEYLGHRYHLEMLEAFVHDRDYERAVVLAQHLSKPLFDGYEYQERAKELAEQIKNRQEDFKTFNLPTSEEWKTLKKSMKKTKQVEYLASRLRLLNCFQWGQPGGVDYKHPQSSNPEEFLIPPNQNRSPEFEVINPYNELQKMNIPFAKLPLLFNYLLDENFMLIYSFHRDFKTGRSLHRVNWAVAMLINEITQQQLIGKDFFSSNETEKKALVQKLLAWCEENAGQNPKELILTALKTETDGRKFFMAAEKALQLEYQEALAIFIDRFDDFPQLKSRIVSFCYMTGNPEAVSEARKWVKDQDKNVRYWAALILLRHGEPSSLEGLDEIKTILENERDLPANQLRHSFPGNMNHYWSQAIGPLLATKNEEAMKLACGILSRNDFKMNVSFQGIRVLPQLFLAGRQECFDFLLQELDNLELTGKKTAGTWNGEQVQRDLARADEIASTIAMWRTDDYRYHYPAPDEERKKEREELKAWLQEQFRLIKAGEKPDMRMAP